MEKIKFFDENTRQWWSPQTGGANIPGLNELLSIFGIQFGNKIYSGSVRWKTMNDQVQRRFYYNSGTSITEFPKNGMLISAPLKDETIQELSGVSLITRSVPIIGLLQTQNGGGRIATFGDSGCVDNSFYKEEVSFFFFFSVFFFLKKIHF